MKSLLPALTTAILLSPAITVPSALAGPLGAANQMVGVDESPFSTFVRFPNRVPGLTGSPPEGFAIGHGLNGYSGSLDGSIYKVDLRSAQGSVLVDVVEPWTVDTCRLLGLRVDLRTNYLFGAGCFFGNAFVYDADDGSLLMEYQLDSSGNSVINDMAITEDAVYFTDFNQPFLYKLPLSNGGELPAVDAAVTIPLTGDIGPGGVTNGIVAMPDGATLVVGNSFTSQLFKVNANTGETTEIAINPPLNGFLDGIAMRDQTLYIMTPFDPVPGSVDRIQIVELSNDLLSGTLVGTITNPNLDGVASGALSGNRLYVNNARYNDFPQFDTAYWLTQLKLPVLVTPASAIRD